jgi:hypothetical protein
LCNSNEFWDYKIDNEVGLSKDQYLPTLIPRKWKYVELKSIRSIEYGSEYFISIHVCLERSSRLTDRQLAEELTEHFYEIIEYRNDRNYYIYDIIEGATARNDFAMVNKYKSRIVEIEFDEQRVVDNKMASGYAEVGNMEKVEEIFNTKFACMHESYQIEFYDNVLRGLAKNGNINLFKQYEKYIVMYGIAPRDIIVAAVKYDNWNIVNYILEKYIDDNSGLSHYSRESTVYSYLSTLIELGYNDIFIKNYPDLFTEKYCKTYKDYSFYGIAAESGNIGLMRFLSQKSSQFNKRLESMAFTLIVNALSNNHIDFVEFVREFIPLEIIQAKSYDIEKGLPTVMLQFTIDYAIKIGVLSKNIARLKIDHY